VAIKKPGRLETLFLFAALAAAPAASRAEALNRVVLRVNDRIATLYDYEQRKEEAVQQIARREQDPQERQQLLARAGAQVFKEMYQDLLLESRADQLNIEVTPEQIEANLADTKKRVGINSDEDFKAALQQWGLTEAQVREQMRANIRVQQVMREVNSRIKLEEEDLRRYYRKNEEQFREPEQLHLREVVVLEEKLPFDQRAQVSAAIAQAVAGGQDLPDAAADGIQKGIVSSVIDLGWVSPGDLDPTLERAAWKLPVNAVTEPVPGRGGTHLLQVVERRESRIPPFADVQDRIRRIEGERLFREESVKYMQELEKKSLIVANPPQEAANFRTLLENPAEAAGSPEQAGTGLGDQPAAPVSEAAPGAPDQQGATPGAAPGTATPLPPTTPPAGQPGTLPEPKPTVTDPPPPPPGA
jgi:parvulin-like peptidyl-prolyl isomerase